MKLFFIAFIHKHELMNRTSEPGSSNLTEEELFRLVKIMQGLSNSEVPVRRLKQI